MILTDIGLFNKDQMGCKDCYILKDKGKFCRNHQMMFNRIGRVEAWREFGYLKVW